MDVIGIYACGIGDQELAELRYAMDHHEPNRFALATDEGADFVILDGDALDARSQLSAEFGRSPARPLIVWRGDQARDFDLDHVTDAVVLNKPIDIDDTLAALDLFVELVSGHPIAVEVAESVEPRALDPVARPDPGPVAGELAGAALKLLDLATGRSLGLVQVPTTGVDATYDPARHLDGRLVAMIADARTSAYRRGLLVGKERVVFDPGLDCFIVDDSDQMVLLAHAESRSSPKSFRVGPDTRLGELSVSAEVVLWEAAVLASAGRRPAPVASDHRLILDTWPDMSGRVFVPGCLRLLAAMAQRPASIDELVDQGHERHVVNSFVSALVVTGAIADSAALLHGWVGKSGDGRSRRFMKRFRKGSTSS